MSAGADGEQRHVAANAIDVHLLRTAVPLVNTSEVVHPFAGADLVLQGSFEVFR